MCEEKDSNYWLRKFQLWCILHPRLDYLLRCGGAEKKCSQYYLSPKCRVGTCFYITAGAKQGFLGTIKEVNESPLMLYCAEWIKHE
jgi:hypothetical protein